MRFIIQFCLFLFSFFLVSIATAQTQLALHVSQQELEIWQRRRLDCINQVSGAVYCDDWSRIIGRADGFRSKPYGRWLGNQQNQAWSGDAVRDCQRLPTVYPGGSSSDCAGNGGRRFAAGIRDAGFVYLLTGDTGYRDAVVQLLLEQAADPGTDFSNTTRWPTTYLQQDKDFQISLWLRELSYAYSYVRNSVSQSHQLILDAWFLSAAQWSDAVLNNELTKRFPGRLNDNYATSAGCGSTPSSGWTKSHWNGYLVYSFGYGWDNKNSQLNAVVADVGVLLKNSVLMSHAKRFVKEFIKYNTYPDGTVWDQRRWGQTDGTPQTGWSYAATVIGTNITTADTLARAGDTELYTYTTSEGICGSAGGSKSLLKVLQHFANLTLGREFVYASTDSTLSDYERIDPDGESPNSTKHYVTDVALAQANLYYQDALLKACYTRPMVSSPSSGGYDAFGGDWGNLPGVRFMFGKLEGQVWPYPSANGGTEPPSPGDTASPTINIISPANGSTVVRRTPL